ncbi:Cof-type HAD-IIB family hydrolase [Ileibacterium valens]|uniref:Haloacid dehalogenase n=2 Tax=Ileibacterium valens TaxID=1862668 RepID=A0A1U7NFH0_9FIRM|nr:Cof-type HAD-IIB family hydrolase [Ileibacterium valens]OLU39079.1 hypothetical protein BO222_07305 [Ileibacterium valens]OLU41728.1 hypothetical protein BM735_03720 [Erysipelotrichaceae bacterium NYU-BL-F16]OLU41816.1 hypothetical protein BO224_02905 [Erysipelotrichaceae bacterium NYU-BL-E8]
MNSNENVTIKGSRLTHPEKIRMVVCDLDGTLLYRPSSLSENAKEIIRKIRKQGILFGICSGRPIDGLRNMLPVWGIENDVDFVLGFNGGAIYYPKTQKTDSWLNLKQDQIKEVMDTFNGYSVIFAEYKGEEILADRTNFLVSQMAKRNRLKLKVVSRKDLEQDTLKLMAVGMPWTISRYLKNHHNDLTRGYRFFQSGPFLIEIISSQLSKLEGVLKVADEMKIRPDEILSFGNDNNDLEMLEGTIGVAVSNALGQVKEKAKYIAQSNSKDGVAQFLRDNLLKRE